MTNSKGRSPLKQKWVAYQKRTYKNPMAAAAYEPCGCDARAALPQHLVDAIEERKLSGGFNTARSNQCGTCFQAKSTNGTCGCTQ